MADQEIQIWEVKEPYLDLHCKLGEGPYYEKATHSLRFVDIKKKRIHTVDLAAGPDSLMTLELDTHVTVTADIEGVDPREKMLIGAKYGVAVLDRKTGRYEYVSRFHAPEDRERLRSNDGAVDPNGRFWLGTMTDIGLDLQAEGALHLFQGKNPSKIFREPVTIPNAISWSPDTKTMYFTHSTARTIHAYDYDASNGGSVSNERVFYQHQGPAEPDGHRVDIDGNVWTALYGEGKVLKLGAVDGRVLGEVRLPTRNITCVQFIGTELFVTTAGMEEGEGTAEEVGFSGGVYRVDVGTTGLEPFLFKLDG